jgi:hypothetical protein
MGARDSLPTIAFGRPLLNRSRVFHPERPAAGERPPSCIAARECTFWLHSFDQDR